MIKWSRAKSVLATQSVWKMELIRAHLVKMLTRVRTYRGLNVVRRLTNWELNSGMWFRIILLIKWSSLSSSHLCRCQSFTQRWIWIQIVKSHTDKCRHIALLLSSSTYRRIHNNRILVRYCPRLTDDNVKNILLEIPRKPPDTEVTIKCRAGYVLRGQSVLSCTGSWSGSLPSCQKYGLLFETCSRFQEK